MREPRFACKLFVFIMTCSFTSLEAGVFLHPRHWGSCVTQEALADAFIGPLADAFDYSLMYRKEGHVLLPRTEDTGHKTWDNLLTEFYSSSFIGVV